ncbi:MAG: bifunctional metallophosphatase/5'-nucleotidase [Beijerinckiaceae bacterium]
MSDQSRTDMTRRQAFTIAAAAGLAATTIMAASPEEALAQAANQGTNPTFILLLVNDIYKMSEVRGRGGFARLAAIARAERAKGIPMLYAHAGDMFSPSLMSGFDQGQHTVELLNVVPPDIFVPGNHEFDAGKDNYFKLTKLAKYPTFAANMRAADGSVLPDHQDRKVIDLGPVKVGIFGVVLASTPLMSSSGDIKFLDEMACVREQSKALKDAGADMVVAVTHTDFTRDLEIARSRLVDVLLTGHDHDLRVVYDNRTVMVESGEEGEYVTAVDIYATIAERDGKRTVTWLPRFRVIDSGTVTPDPEALAIVKKYEGELSRELDVDLGTTAVDLDSRSASVRSQETAIGNLIADAMRASTNADVAITNGGGIRGNKQYPAGSKITRRDILTELPFGNATSMVEVTGKDIKDALENGVSQIDNRAGRFPQVSGMVVTVDTKAAVGSRIASITIAGKPIDPAAWYKVATNDFMVGGGDGYGALARGRVIIGKTDGKLMASVVMSHIRQAGNVQAKIDGRIILK